MTAGEAPKLQVGVHVGLPRLELLAQVHAALVRRNVVNQRCHVLDGLDRDEVHADKASQARGPVAQQKAGVAVEEKLCDTFGELSELQPPAGSPAGNPSRAFEQKLHSTLVDLGIDLGCRLP